MDVIEHNTFGARQILIAGGNITVPLRKVLDQIY